MTKRDTDDSRRDSAEGVRQRRATRRASKRQERKRRFRAVLPWALAVVALVAAAGAGVLAWRASRATLPAPTAGVRLDAPVPELTIAPKPPDAFRQPTGVAVSGDRVYIADPGRAAVLVFTRAGSRVATIGAGDLVTPVYVGVGPIDGRLYVVDRGRNAIAVYSADGKRLRDLPPGGTGPAPQDTLKPWRPLALGFAPDGTLYVADVEGDQHIAVFSPLGVRIGTIGDGLPLGRSGHHLAFPNGIVAFEDALVVNDSNNGRLLLMDRAGVLRRSVFVGGLPRGGAALDAGRFVVADASMHSLRVFSSDGAELQRSGEFGTATGQFAYPAGVAVDASGRVYIADTGNARVQVVRIPGAGAPVPKRPTGAWPWALAALALAAAAIALVVWGLLRNRSSSTAQTAEVEL